MKRAPLVLILILLASLGVSAGLALHIREEWREDQKARAQYAALPGRLSLTQFIDGDCDGPTVTLNSARVADHLQEVQEDLDLTAAQSELIGQLILSRVQVGCGLRAQRAEIRAAARQDPLGDPETARPFLQALLGFRQQLTQETLKETAIHRQLLASFSDDQLRAIDARNLPQLVPGLSLREFVGAAPSGGKDRGYRR